MKTTKPLSTLADWQQLQQSAIPRFKAVNVSAREKLGFTVQIEKIGGVDVHVLTPKSYREFNKDKALIYIHGGGYVIGSAQATYFVCSPIAHYSGLKIYSIDYRLAPQHPFPAALDDCVGVYRKLVKRFPPENIGVFGESAGGSLAVAMLLKAGKENQLPMPAALASLTPWSDLDVDVGDSYGTLSGIDPIIHPRRLALYARAYATKAQWKDPLVSPVHGKYSKRFPPTFIQTGTRDLCLSNSARLYQKMKRDGVNVELSVHEGMWHGFQVIPHPFFKEAIEANKETAAFLSRQLKVR